MFRTQLAHPPVSRSQRYPWCLTDEQRDALRRLQHNLDTPDRHAFWFNMGKADGLRGYRCIAPETLCRERRLYRLGWIFGYLKFKPQGSKLSPCCAASNRHRPLGYSDRCWSCGTENLMDESRQRALRSVYRGNA